MWRKMKLIPSNQFLSIYYISATEEPSPSLEVVNPTKEGEING